MGCGGMHNRTSLLLLETRLSFMASQAFKVLKSGVKVDRKRFGSHVGGGEIGARECACCFGTVSSICSELTTVDTTSHRHLFCLIALLVAAKQPVSRNSAAQLAALDFFAGPGAPAPRPGKRQRAEAATKEVSRDALGHPSSKVATPGFDATRAATKPSNSDFAVFARTDEPDALSSAASALSSSVDEASLAIAAASAAQDAGEALRESVGLRVRGEHPPLPLASFAELEQLFVSCEVVGAGGAASAASAARAWRSVSRAVESSDYKEPTAVQMQVFSAMIAGRDVLASAPTGSGKTAAFVIPIIAKLRCHVAAGPRAIILAPTRELVQQIAREGRRLSSGTGLRFSELTKGAAFGAFGAEMAAATALATDGSVCDSSHRSGRIDDDKHGNALEAAAVVADEDGIPEDAPDDGDAETPRGGSASGPHRPKKLERQRIPAVDVLVTTPQRLAWLVEAVTTASATSSSPAAAAPPLALPHVRMVVLDEADRLLQAGDRAALRALDGVLSAAPASAQRALFSATVHSGVEEAAGTVLRDAVSITVGRAMAAASSVEQRLVFVGREAGKLLELRQMAKTGFAPPVLVFLQSKERAEDACHELRLDGIRADVIHSDRPPAEREEVIRRFRSGEVWMLLATEVVARGLDFKAVKTVVNFDVPATVSEYVHRIGRTGRAGRAGTAITLFTEADFALMRPIANVAKLSGADVQPWLLTLAKPSGRRKAKTVTRTAVSRELDRERYEARERRRQSREGGKVQVGAKNKPRRVRKGASGQV